jgi:DNA (cytosine-5)-methyltransferase 1
LGQEEAAFTLATGADQHLFHNSELDGIGLVNTIQSQGINQSTYADAEKAGSVKILRALQEALGEEAFFKWTAGIVAALFPAEILRIFVHGIGVRQPAIDEFGLVNYALSRPENRSERALRSLREAGCSGRTPQGWESHEQFAGELGAYLSELSQPTSSAKGFLLDLWQAAEGLGILRQTLSTLQEAREPANREGKPAYGSTVRRLTPVEAEFLQGFPRNFTAIPYKGNPADICPDGPRYKALGNSWAVPCASWIFNRINAL